jgi:hypothetical protein
MRNVASGKPSTSSIDKITARIPKLDRLCPQQIVSHGKGDLSVAALVDQWGRVHALSPTTVLGRELEDNDLAILDNSVSRNHAELRLSEDAWWVEDRGSTNGTFVEGKRIDAATELADGDRLTIGEVGFAFYERGAELLDGIKSTTMARTVRSDAEPEEPTLLLLGQVSGGGGIVEYEGTYVQLGPSQYALVDHLASRWAEETTQDDAVRGYARSIDLLHALPWDTPYPEDNNVKQLVRRVRRAFERLEAPNPIESRYGFGYRLSLRSRIQDSKG